MDLWIRSQNGIILTPNPKMQIIEEDGKYNILEIMTYEYKLFLGEYKTKERTLEVLDEIQDLISEYEYMHISQTKIYEMPKEW